MPQVLLYRMRLQPQTGQAPSISPLRNTDSQHRSRFSVRLSAGAASVYYILKPTAMMTRVGPPPRLRRYCLALVGVLALGLLLHEYVFFALSYAHYAWQLYMIDATQYTIVVSPTATNASPVEPLVLHQTYRTEDSVPERWHNTSESCRHMHRHWSARHFWTDESGRQFIRDNFPPAALANYDSYMFPIQRADALRYYVLYYYGGVYLDLDIGCLAALDERGVTRYPFALAATVPIGFSNDFMVARRGHPFLLHLIERLVRHNHWYINYYLTVMYSTGPMFLTICYIEYMQQLQRRQLVGPSVDDADAIYLLNETLYGATNHPQSLFYHVEGSSWHNYRAPKTN